MLADKYLRDELNKFAKYVIQQSRSNLTKGKKNASKELYNSLGYDITQKGDTTSMGFKMADYGTFQDRGVSGKEKKYNTPYSYTTKMPPRKAFDKWIVRKGIAPRGKGGKFLSRQSLQYLIARAIYKKGIKPSLFFTKPFEKAFKNLDKDIIEAYKLDVEELLKFTTNGNN